MNLLEKEVEGLQFLDKLIIVCEQGRVDLWEDREYPSNLSRDEFELVLSRVDEIRNFKIRPRKSKKGPHGPTGEENCFYFGCEIQFGGIFNIVTRFFFIKGYFFDKGNLLGVTIQSFREE